ncbi:hypothetical protein HOP50_09g55400 [Chloropicon primus]|uniref:Uncharacterized protein n=1 Tax=Chloropicon primus TaxID=1764295 RepID=A0A5B8MRU6_9CHLO|nr:hypothetical protein A3770_09p55150 [Chloropicon primus]UPR02214.1 hypothetical protein HOP50_09g55400 [Chloropicon primus]|eukprot:QDZ22997.1 hypothetical protein A3770_09p55150 [Chloropicon primus]
MTGEGEGSGGRSVQSMQGLAKFSCGIEALCDDYVKLQRGAIVQREEAERRARDLEILRGESLRYQDAVKALSHENEVLRGQVDFLQRKEREREGVTGKSADLSLGEASCHSVHEVEEIKKLERDRCHYKHCLAESEQKHASLQRRLEGKSAIVDALSKELTELQAMLSKGLGELTDTKKHLCDLAKHQYENVLKIKQVSTEVQEKEAGRRELELALAKETIEKERTIQAKKDVEWELQKCKQQVQALAQERGELSSILKGKDREKDAHAASLAEQSKEIEIMIEELRRHLKADAIEEGDALVLNLKIEAS